MQHATLNVWTNSSIHQSRHGCIHHSRNRVSCDSIFIGKPEKREPESGVDSRGRRLHLVAESIVAFFSFSLFFPLLYDVCIMQPPSRLLRRICITKKNFGRTTLAAPRVSFAKSRYITWRPKWSMADGRERASHVTHLFLFHFPVANPNNFPTGLIHNVDCERSRNSLGESLVSLSMNSQRKSIADLRGDYNVLC